VLLPEPGVEPSITLGGVAQLRVGGDEPRCRGLSVHGHGWLLRSGSPSSRGRCARQVHARRPELYEERGRRSSASISPRSVFSWAASGRAGHGVRSVTMGGAARSRVTAVPKGKVRSRSGGKTDTRRTERWFCRVP